MSVDLDLEVSAGVNLRKTYHLENKRILFLAVIATCWATMLYFGRDGYIEATKKIVAASKYIEDGLVPQGTHLNRQPCKNILSTG